MSAEPKAPAGRFVAILRDGQSEEISWFVTSNRVKAIKDVDQNVGVNAASGVVINDKGKVIHQK